MHSCYCNFFEIYFRTITGSSTGSYTTTGTRTQTGVSANWDSEDDSEEEEEEKQQHRSPAKRESPKPKPATKQKRPVVLPRKSVSFEDDWDDESQVSQSQTQSNWDDTRWVIQTKYWWTTSNYLSLVDLTFSETYWAGTSLRVLSNKLYFSASF